MHHILGNFGKREQEKFPVCWWLFAARPGFCVFDMLKDPGKKGWGKWNEKCTRKSWLASNS